MRRLGKMRGMQSHYEELGIDPSASTKEIHTAYRFLAPKFHPDLNVGREAEAKRRFLRVQAAFDVLSDQRMKAVYDAGLAAKPIIQILQTTPVDVPDNFIHPVPFEPISIGRTMPLRRKRKASLSGAMWFLIVCVFVAALICYLTWQNAHRNKTEFANLDSTAQNQPK